MEDHRLSTDVQEAWGGNAQTFELYSKHLGLGQKEKEQMLVLLWVRAWSLPAQAKPSRYGGAGLSHNFKHALWAPQVAENSQTELNN